VNYREQRVEAGVAPATIDKQVSIAETMIIKVFDDDRIGGDVVKAFRIVKKKLKKGINERIWTITIDHQEKKGFVNAYETL
jgi:hypothetical protein